MRLLTIFLKFSQFTSDWRLLGHSTYGVIRSLTVDNSKTVASVTKNKSMKRIRVAARIQRENAIEENQEDERTGMKIEITPKVLLDKKPKLNLKSLQNRNDNDVNIAADLHDTVSTEKSKTIYKEPRIGSFVEMQDELKSNTSLSKGKQRAIVDLRTMKEELNQLEDPPVTSWEKQLSSGRLRYEFFNIPCEELAQRLLGKILVRYLENGTILKGRIVETEGYLGAIDKASHSYRNKITSRNLPMYMPPGTIYIYMTYGMYHCFNISSQGDGCAVLVRALDPLEGIEQMTDQRNTASKRARKTGLKLHELCNGPSKLCMAYQLHKYHSRYSLCTWKALWIEDDGASSDFKIVKSARIGIDSCGPEWANKPLRYYICGNRSVSKRDKKAEMEIH